MLKKSMYVILIILGFTNCATSVSSGEIVGNSDSTREFKPVAVLEFSRDHGSNYNVVLGDERYDDGRRNMFFSIENNSLPDSHKQIFKMEISSTPKVIERGNKYFFYRELNQVSIPCQIWKIDLDTYTATYLLDGCADFAVSASGRYVALFEDCAQEEIYWDTKLTILDLDKKEYVWTYNFEDEVRKLYPKIDEDDRVSISLEYDEDKLQFYIDTYFHNVSQKVKNDTIGIYLPTIYE